MKKTLLIMFAFVSAIGGLLTLTYWWTSMGLNP